MRRKINLLSEETIIKIAAGEIIENPSSIIKELVENSIDAKSTNIKIEIKNNGKDYIKVSDNGEGFKKEDLKIAFKRHTTSKIENINDLDKALTLGFRGEALSSIANVSNVTVITKTDSDDIGTIARINHSGNVISTKEIVTNNGTTIICENLFENIPVRKKYLESKNFEVNKTNDIITRLALSHRDISIEYIRDDKLIYKTNNNASQINNIYSILGKNVSENLLKVEYEGDKFSIFGFISNSNLYKSNRNNQFIFVNNRTIIDSNISKTIEKQYGSIIPLNRYPAFILYLNIDTSLVDINIHPKKDIVKFLNIDDIEYAMSCIVGEKIKDNLRVYEVNKDNENSNYIFEKYKNKSNEQEKDIEKSIENTLKFIDFTNSEVSENLQDTYINNKNISNPNQKINKYNVDKIIDSDNFVIAKEENKVLPNGYRYIGNLFFQYILLEDNFEKSLYILDQHAAHERINYEKLLKDFEEKNIPVQTLLNGYIVELTIPEFEILLSIKESIEDIGIEIDEFGDSSIIIRTIPAYLENIDPERLVREILDNTTEIRTSVYDINPNILMKKACSASVKTGQQLSRLDVVSLIENLNKCKMPFTCPHGRPTLTKITKNQLDKEFFRIQNER